MLPRSGLVHVAVLAGTLCALACDASREGEPQPSAAISELSTDGHYRVTLEPRDGAIPLNAMHAWTVSVATQDGAEFRPTRLAFSGGMPQHQHGFVTEPRVTRALGGGRFLIEGVKFHMAGEWTLRVELVGPRGPDVAVLRVVVGP